MAVLRTPDERFSDIPDYPFTPRYTTVSGDGIEGALEADGGLRMHYLDEGPTDGAVVLLLHGEPSWSFLYRFMIPPLVAAGCRVVVPDLIGFGRSDKPDDRSDYTYERHVGWVTEFVSGLGLRDITLFCQDWGGLLGLVVLAQHPDWFRGVLASNTGLPPGADIDMGDAFRAWREHSQTAEVLNIGQIFGGQGGIAATARALNPAEIAAYEAPFPDESYKAGAREFPALVVDRADMAGAAMLREAWESIMTITVPLLCVFGEDDPITSNVYPMFTAMIPAAAGQPHAMLANAGHFIQEDQPEALVEALLALMQRTNS